MVYRNLMEALESAGLSAKGIEAFLLLKPYKQRWRAERSNLGRVSLGDDGTGDIEATGAGAVQAVYYRGAEQLMATAWMNVVAGETVHLPRFASISVSAV